MVSAHRLARLTEQSRWEAIRALNERSLERLQTLLAQEHDTVTKPDLGREDVLVTQLVANSALWLRDNPMLSLLLTGMSDRRLCRSPAA